MIAWDGETLAADKCSTSGYVQRKVNKTYKGQWFDGRQVLIGFAGSGAFAEAIKAALREGSARPVAADYDVGKDDAVGLLVDEERRIYTITSRLELTIFEETKFAFGAGAECAFGALEAGASAQRAVEIASKRTSGSGLGVDCVRF